MLKKLLRLTGILAILVTILGGVSASAQNRAIRGTVVDATGAPVVGAAIVVVGNTSIGAVTGADGSYRLNVPAGASVEVSCIPPALPSRSPASATPARSPRWATGRSSTSS